MHNRCDFVETVDGKPNRFLELTILHKLAAGQATHAFGDLIVVVDIDPQVIAPIGVDRAVAAGDDHHPRVQLGPRPMLGVVSRIEFNPVSLPKAFHQVDALIQVTLLHKKRTMRAA